MMPHALRALATTNPVLKALAQLFRPPLRIATVSTAQLDTLLENVQKYADEATAFRKVEEFLSEHQQWTLLRDFYLGHAQMTSLSSLAEEAHSKSYLLATTLAPQPLHALFASPVGREDRDLDADGLVLRRILLVFMRQGWWGCVEHLLSLAPSSLSLSLDRDALLRSVELQRATTEPLEPRQDVQQLLALHNDPSSLGQRSMRSEQALLEAAQLSTQRLQESEPESRKQRDFAIQTWQTLLQGQRNSTSWLLFYKTTLDAKRWDVINAVLSEMPLALQRFPLTPVQNSLLLQAQRRGELPDVDPLPLHLAAFLSQPQDVLRFRRLSRLLLKGEQFPVLAQVLRYHLTAASGSHVIKESLLRLLKDAQLFVSDDKATRFPAGENSQISALELKDLPPPTPEEPAWTWVLVALSFAPNDRELLELLMSWAAKVEPSHPLFPLLEACAHEGRGDLQFQYRVSRLLARFPQGRAGSIGMLHRIVQGLHVQQTLSLPVVQDLLGMARFAIDELQELSVFLHVLGVVLEQRPETAEVFSLVEHAQSLEGADEELLNFLLDYESSMPVASMGLLQFHVIKLLFRLERTEAAQLRCRKFLRLESLTPALLQQFEACVMFHQHWLFAAEALQRRIQWFQQQRQDAPWAHLYLQLGDLYALLPGRQRDALAAYRMALLYPSTKNEAWARLQHLLQESGDFGEARTLLIEQIEAEAEPRLKAQRYVELALLEKRSLQQTVRALLCVLEALRLDPGFEDAEILFSAWCEEALETMRPVDRVNACLRWVGDIQHELRPYQIELMIHAARLFATTLNKPRVAKSILMSGLKRKPKSEALQRAIRELAKYIRGAESKPSPASA